MNRRLCKSYYQELCDIYNIDTIQFYETVRSDAGEQLTYDVALTVFYDETNFTVKVYDFNHTPQTQQQLVGMAIKKLKHIANEKAR